MNIDPKNIYLSINGVRVESSEFADAPISLNLGGDMCVTNFGLAGGSQKAQKYDQEHTVSFQLFQQAASCFRLESYKNSRVQFSIAIRDLNPPGKAYASIDCQVKSMSELPLGSPDPVTFVIDCTTNGLKPQHVAS